MGDIQSLKEQIGQDAENIIAKGLHLERIGNKYRCPNKAAHKHGDKNPSMAWHEEGLQFNCFTCGISIDIYSYYRDYLDYSHMEALEAMGMEKTNNIRPTSKANDQIAKFNNEVKKIMQPTSSTVDYLNKRALDDSTIKYFKLGTYQGKPAISYYSDNGKITGVKVRKLNNTKPKYYAITGSKFGLYNKQNIKDESQLIITEGEFDCMIIHQCGFYNVVSVGTGVNSLKELFEQEKSYLDKFNCLIILSDNDEHGPSMDKSFLKEFGYKVKLPNKELYEDCKDINEVFLKYGDSQVKKIVDSAMRKIEGLRDLDNQPYRGLSSVEGRYIPTGIRSIDYAINDLAPGLVTLVTGRSNGGKSTFVNQIMCNAINEGSKVLLIAGEGLQEHLINTLYKAAIGRDEDYFEYKQINKRKFKEPKSEVLKALQQWHKGKFTLFSKGDSNLKTTDELFEMMNIEIKTNRYDLVVIDNLMSVLSIEKASEKLEKQSDFMQRLCDLAKAESLHSVLVLHPNKTVQKGSNMEFDQISGTLDLPNKADNIISVKRHYDEEYLSKGIHGEIEILKNRYFTDLVKVETHFDEETGLLLEIDKNTGDYLAYSFGWMQYLKGYESNYLIPEGFQEIVRDGD